MQPAIGVALPALGFALKLTVPDGAMGEFGVTVAVNMIEVLSGTEALEVVTTTAGVTIVMVWGVVPGAPLVKLVSPEVKVALMVYAPGVSVLVVQAA